MRFEVLLVGWLSLSAIVPLGAMASPGAGLNLDRAHRSINAETRALAIENRPDEKGVGGEDTDGDLDVVRSVAVGSVIVPCVAADRGMTPVREDCANID